MISDAQLLAAHRTWWPWPLPADDLVHALALARDPDTPLRVLEQLPGHWDVLAVLVARDPFPTRLRTLVWQELRLGPRPWLAPGVDLRILHRRWVQLVGACPWLVPDRFAQLLRLAAGSPEFYAETVPVLAAHPKFTIAGLGVMLDRTYFLPAPATGPDAVDPGAQAREDLLGLFEGLGPNWALVAGAYRAALAHRGEFEVSWGWDRLLLRDLGSRLAACSAATLALLPGVVEALGDEHRFPELLDLSAAAGLGPDRSGRRRIRVEDVTAPVL